MLVVGHLVVCPLSLPPTVKQLRKLSQAQCNNLMGRTALVVWPKLLNSVELDHTITSPKEHLIAFFNQFMQFPIE